MNDVLTKKDVDLLTASILRHDCIEKQAKELKTVEQALKFVEQEELAFFCVPKELQTTEFWVKVLKYCSSWNCVQKNIQEESMTAELWLEAVKNDCDAFAFIPEELKTLDMCIETVKQKPWMLMAVPENLKEQVTKATRVLQGGTAILHNKHKSVLENGKKEIFEKEVERICFRIITLCEKVREEGIVALGNYIDKEKLMEKDFLETGVQMVVEGKDIETIEEYLNSWIEANCNNSVAYYEKILAIIIKNGVFCICTREHPRIAEYKMTVIIPRELTPDSLLPEKETYFRRPNIETIMQDMRSAYKYISRGLELFCYLELKMYKDLIGESINYDDEIGEINKKIANATEIVERLHILVPIRIKTANEVLTRIKLWASSLDSNVSLANYAIFDLIDSDKWTTDILLEYKKSYKELIKLVSWIYNISMRFKAEYNSVIMKTKDIFGKQLNEKALLPSATDNNAYEWITSNQFEAGMKSSELKPSKNDNQDKKEAEELC